MKKFYDKFRWISLCLCIILSVDLIGQGTATVTGSTVNSAGNSAIPSIGDGGCGTAPQSTGGPFSAGSAWSGGTVFVSAALGTAPSCGAAVLASVNVNFTHTWTGDLDIFLRNQTTNQIIALSTANGGGGDNFSNTRFCDNAACTSVTGGAAPFSGTFRPEGLGGGFCALGPVPNVATLASFPFVSGHVYELIIYDNAGGDQGVMSSWSLVFAAAPPAIPVPAPVTLGLAPGLCTPAPVPCLAANACWTGLRYTTAAVTAATICDPSTVGSLCTASGIVFTAPGTYNITWIAHNDCRFVLATQMVTIQDLEPPVFSPACPTVVTLNAGPGE